MPKYQILSLDGGGIRGLLTVRLLERLATTRGLEGAFDNVYLIAGNSSGALIALGMSAARTVGKPTKTVLAEIVDMFREGKDVFGPGLPIWLGGLWAWSKYGTAARKSEIESRLQTIKLRELGTKVVITTFDLDKQATEDKTIAETTRRWEPKIFHNFRRTDGHAPKGPVTSDRSYRASDVALYSTAAPTYFPTVNGYIDGAVYANNPGMCALAQMLDFRYEPTPKPTFDEISMLSIGAGRNPRYIEGDTLHWGAIKWGLNHYVEMTTEASVGVADFQCRQLLGDDHYHRCDVDFTQESDTFKLDDIKRVDRIAEIANDHKLDEEIEWLKEHWAPRPQMVTVPSDVTSKHLAGASELTCLMPIRTGFVDVFETHTYATRLRILLRTLHGLRQGAREVAEISVLPDIVDRVRSIHSFRLAILGNQLLLAVNFDRPWEPYMRVVWREFGPLLDLILVNCEGYDGHQTDKGFDAFSAWIREHQVDAGLFYVRSAYTVDDVDYLTRLDRLVRRRGGDQGFDRRAARLRMLPVERIARRAASRNKRQLVEQGLIALSVFYKLRELYRDGTPEGEYLNAAVAATLRTFQPDQLPLTADERTQYANELKWFTAIKSEKQAPDRRVLDRRAIQGGIVTPYRGTTHGCLLLARIENVDLARAYLKRLLEKELITRGDGGAAVATSTNIAFTFEGLKRLGLSPAEVALLPKEFREGMEARAGLLGDIGANHPDNWQLPAWNWDDEHAEARTLERVRLSTIDLIIELRGTFARRKDDHLWTSHPLHDAAHALVQTPVETGIRVLSVEPMLVHRDKDDGKVVEHFGYRDNLSQPRVDAPGTRDSVSPGEFVVGYENSRGDVPFYEGKDPRSTPGAERGSLLDNGAFLVVRKLEQHVGRLHKAVADFVSSRENPGLTLEEVYGKLMGRNQKGVPVTGPESAPNEFSYKGDDGSRCPLHAHVRRSNPRTDDVPRIARRGMSYGPGVEDDPDAERGMIFLAYNASIAEQYEVIQRWMTGGNSTRGFSGRADPFLRVPHAGSDNLYLIPHNGRVGRMDLGDQPILSLRWGLYLFVPSLAAIARLAGVTTADSREQPRKNAPELSPEVLLGQTVITSLQTDEEWEAILSDSTAISSGRTAAVCAAIRELHRGVIRTSSRGGLVLVANHQLTTQVLTDDELFSVSEYRMRMQESIGDIYLGHDSKDAEYKRWSSLPNEAIGNVTELEAFCAARAETAAALTRALDRRVQETVRVSLEDIIDVVLAKLSEDWFGIPDGFLIKCGGRPTDPSDTSLHCPFSYLAPSRYIFSSPRPRSIVTGAGESFGERLREATAKLAQKKVEDKEWAAHMRPITRAVWEASKKEPGKDPGKPNYDLFARLMVGVMEGFLPTVYGNFYKTMYLWLGDDTFWRVQQNLRLANADRNPALTDLERVRSAVLPAVLQAMQRRPVPDMLYRTATRRCLIGNVVVEPEDRVVVLVGSVTQELAATGDTTNVYPVFGGDRRQAGHPTHACPGYQMAIGVMLGAVAAVLEAGAYAATASPLVVNLRPLPAGSWAGRGEEGGEVSAAG